MKKANMKTSAAMSAAKKTEAYSTMIVSFVCPYNVTRLNRYGTSDTEKSIATLSILVVLFSIGSTDIMPV